MVANDGQNIQPGVPSMSAAAAGPPALVRLDALLASIVKPALLLEPAQARFVAAGALGLGLWLDLLFANAGTGINLPLWLGSAVLAAILSARRLGRPLASDRAAVLGVAVVLAAVVAWRDSVALQALGVLGATALTVLGVALPAGTQVRRVTPASCLLALTSAVVALATSAWRVGARMRLGELRALQGGAAVRPLVRPVLIALPLLVVFGALFVAADAVFEARVAEFFSFDVPDVTPHVLRVLLGAWLAMAMLWATACVEPPREVDVALPERHLLRRVEVGIILGSLAVLFALFVVVQIRYLFGGEDAVRSSVALTYAQYARRGFFELVIASLLLLPVLAATNWARTRNAGSLRLFLALAGALGLLLFVIMASAGQRLAMYLEAFGLTELRLYAAATLPWLTLTLLAFYAAVATGRVRGFLAIAIGLGVVTVLVLDVVNPDALIVRTNAARAAEGRAFDAVYAASLSADAVSALLAHLGDVPANERCRVHTALRAHAQPRRDLRSWNRSRAVAARQAQARFAELRCN